MNAKLARSILRIVAVLLMIYGGLHLTITLIGSFAMLSMDPALREAGMKNAITTSSLASALYGFAIAAWGKALFDYSPRIADKIVAEPAPREAPLVQDSDPSRR